MELAINFSEPAAELLQAGKIPLDRFKVPDWPDLIERARRHLPVYVHFAINAGADDSQTTDWPLVQRMLRETETPFVNLHLAPRAKQFPSGDVKAVVWRLVEDVKRVADFFGSERVICENVPLGNADEDFAPACADPEVIAEVLDRTGTGFLLDLSHARMSARFLKLDERTYVSAMPLDRLRELHVTGLRVVDGRLRDHMPLSEPDWEMAGWAMGEIHTGRWATPRLVALEYGGIGEKFAWRTERSVIAEQAPRLFGLVHDLHSAL